MRRSRFKLKPCTLIAASVSLIFAQAAALANPTGPQVVNGAVSFQQPNVSTLNITNSPGSIINWQGFSIGSSEITRFIQQSASSAVLNRVVGSNLSQIYGQLLSNGRVFLINPGGIVVGPGAIVDTAGFVASTLNMLDSDFLDGKLRFQGDASSGSIINQGWIRTGYGGKVVLVAPTIENSGLIHTPGGELILAAGQKLTITSLDLEGVQFEVQAPTDTVVNVGKLLADGGAVGVFAGTLRHTGEIRANSLVYDQAGRIVLKAQNEIELGTGSATGADGKTGGSITVQTTGGFTRVAGDVSATGSAGPGGTIQLLGNRVAVVDSALVDASGSTGGGRILVGGDYQGGNPAIQNSTNTFVGSGTTLRADATQSGDGGRIIVWSDDKAQFYGSLSAQGGPEGGNGGFAEVSGKQGLVFAGGANLGAPKGSLGNLLLDPLDQYVFTGGGLDSTIINESTDFPSNAATVDPLTLAAIVGNVTLFASRYMRISSAIDLTATSGATPTATPNKGLTVQVGTWTKPASPDPLNLSNSDPSSTDAQINTVLNQLDIGANIRTANGAVSLTAPKIQTFAASIIATAGGAVTLSAAGPIQASLLSIEAGSGVVTATAGTDAAAISKFLQLGAVTGGSFTASAPDSIQMFGAITTGGGDVRANSNSQVSTGNITTSGGSVTLTGTGFSVNTGSITAGSGNVTLSGTGVGTGAIDTSGAVSLTATSGNVSATVNNASSLTASATSGFNTSVTIDSSTDLKVNTVTANCSSFSCASFATLRTTSGATPGSILATGMSSQITGGDVTLTTAALSSANTIEGGRIGTATLPLNVDVKRKFTFSPNNDFNVVLTGTGPNALDLRLGTAAPLDTWGQSVASRVTGNGLTLSASADSTTVTSSLNIDGNVNTRFNQTVFNTNPDIKLNVPNGALVATSVSVPTGDTQPTVAFVHNEVPLPVTVSASGNLALNNYTRASGGLSKSTTITSSGGTVTLGNVDASKDTVSVSGTTGITVGSLISTGNVTLTSLSGAVNAQSDGPGVEITSGGLLRITANGIGTAAIGSPLDLAGSSIELIARGSGAIGGASPVIANTQTLIVDASSGSTFNVSTGATSLANLTVTANPLFVGAGGLAQVSTTGGPYVFTADSLGDFAFTPPSSTGRNVTFTSTTGDIALGSTSLGTGNLILAANNGGIFTNSAAISAANVTMSAGTDIDTSSMLGGPGAITASGGSITLHARNLVTTGALNAPTQVKIDGCFFFCGSPDISVGTVGAVTAPTTIDIAGATITGSGAVTGAGNVTLNASGGLLTVGAITGGTGSTVDLTSNGITAFNFSTINAGATGSVIIKSPQGITQTTALGGITAQTVTLIGSGTALFSSPTASIASPTVPLNLVGTKNLTFDVTNGADINADGVTPFSSVAITKGGTPINAINLTGMAAGQDVNIGGPSTGPFTLDAVSPAGTPLALSFTTTSAGMDIQLNAAGIVTSGGAVSLNAAGAINASAGAITTGGGNVTLVANDVGGVTGSTITTGGGNVNISAFGTGNGISTGVINSGGGSMQLDAAGAINVSGNLTAGAGTIVLLGGTSITRSGSFSVSSSTSVDATAFDGDIGTSGSPLLVTTPSATLSAQKVVAVGSAGHVFATLTGTTDLDLHGDNGFNVSSDTALATVAVSTKGSGTGLPGSNTLNLTATGQTYSFDRPATDLFGTNVSGSAFEVVSVTAPTATATFTATDGILLVRGASGGPNKINVQDLTLLSTNGADIVLQGNSANPLNLSHANQTFSASDASTADLLIRGNVSISASSSQAFSADGNITVNADAGGGGSIAISAPTQTFTTSGFASKMEFLGGAAADEKVTVSASSEQIFNAGASFTSPDTLRLEGGGSSNASVTVTHSGTGSQLFQISGGTVTVKGGGPGSFAKIETTGTNQQQFCQPTSFFFCGSQIGALNVLGGGGSGAFGQITAAGPQNFNIGLATTVKGGTGDGAYALIQSGAGASQTFFNAGNLTVEGVGAAGATATAQILAAGTQAINFANSVSLTGGAGPNSFAKIFTTGDQTVSAGAILLKGTSGSNSFAEISTSGNNQNIFFSSLTLFGGTQTGAYAKISMTGTASPLQRVQGFGAVTLTAGNVANTGAIIEGNHQEITTGALTLTGGTGASGNVSDAVIRNLMLHQKITSSSITLIGGTDFSTTGLLNLGSEHQTLDVSGAISLNSSIAGATANAPVLIQNTPATLQSIDARSISVQTASGSAASAQVFSGGNQWIHTNNPTLTGSSVLVAAGGTGTASIEATASQLLEIDYPQLMQGVVRNGNLTIGDSAGLGTSRIRAADQNVFAGAITIQGPAGVNMKSELKASGAQVITTLQGGINVLGGSGDNTIAQIDPTTQTILTNGTIAVTSGSGNNAVAQIVAASGTTLNGQTILSTNGDIVLTAGGPLGTSSSAALITNTGSSSFVGASGGISLIAGSAPGADAIISVGNGPGVLTFSCGGIVGSCTFPSLGPSPTAGILANQTSASSVFNTTSLTLPLQQDVAGALVEITPAGAATEEPIFGRRVPVCR